MFTIVKSEMNRIIEQAEDPKDTLDYSYEKKKVLITGASGTIGGLVWRNLAGKYEFSGLNRRPVEGIPCLQASIREL